MSERASPQPSRIGPYKILDCLGEGGMGTVYLAEQKEPVQRKVALKVIKLGMDSKAVVARFEQERQALALMQHDGIAKVYDCGTTESGQPRRSTGGIRSCSSISIPAPNRASVPMRSPSVA